MIEITRAQDPYGPDLTIPAAFFLEDMPQLDEISLRVFLTLLAQAERDGSKLDEKALAESLRVSPDRLAESLKLLAARGLLSWTAKGLELTDLRELYRQRALPDSQIVHKSHAEASRRQTDIADLISQINHTFYQGVMPLSFYNSIEKWYLEYGFSADLIYALFNEIKKYQMLQVNNYAEQVAASWHEKGLRTFADLNDRHEANRGLKRYAAILERKLRLPGRMTGYQLDYLRRWLYEWDLPFDLIDEAFRRTASKQAQPNFNYVEAILKNWSDAGLKSLAEIERYESDYQAQRKEQQSLQASRRRPPKAASQAVGNFEQRQYEENEITSLYRSLDFLKSSPAPNPAAGSSNVPATDTAGYGGAPTTGTDNAGYAGVPSVDTTGLNGTPTTDASVSRAASNPDATGYDSFYPQDTTTEPKGRPLPKPGSAS